MFLATHTSTSTYSCEKNILKVREQTDEEVQITGGKKMFQKDCRRVHLEETERIKEF